MCRRAFSECAMTDLNIFLVSPCFDVVSDRCQTHPLKNVVFEKIEIDTFEQVVDSSLPAMELIEIEEDESRKSSVASTQVIQSIFASCDSKSFYFCKHTKIHKDAVELAF